MLRGHSIRRHVELSSLASNHQFTPPLPGLVCSYGILLLRIVCIRDRSIQITPWALTEALSSLCDTPGRANWVDSDSDD